MTPVGSPALTHDARCPEDEKPTIALPLVQQIPSALHELVRLDWFLQEGVRALYHVVAERENFDLLALRSDINEKLISVFTHEKRGDDREVHSIRIGLEKRHCLDAAFGVQHLETRSTEGLHQRLPAPCKVFDQENRSHLGGSLLGKSSRSYAGYLPVAETIPTKSRGSRMK
jgi:hypothetical protein